MDPEKRAKLFDWFDRTTQLPMLVLAAVFLIIIAAPLLMPIPAEMQTALETIDWLIWAAFALELLIKTYLAPRRFRYLYTHWYDVLIVAIPFLRPLRVLRSLRAARELELARLGSVGVEATASARAILSRHGLQYALLVAGLLVVGAAAGETMVERSAGGSIHDFGTGLWWAITTVTTVGYGDVYPVTPEGRGIAVLLMLVGVAIFSFLTANIAAYLVDVQGQNAERVSLEDVMIKLARIESQLARLGVTADVTSPQAGHPGQNTEGPPTAALGIAADRATER